MKVNVSSLEYKEYLQSFKWQLVTKYMISKYPLCSKCSSTVHLQVHHTSYENYPFEKEEDLIILCKKCHYNHHNEGYKFNSQEELDFRRISLENVTGEKGWQFNLQRISGFNDFLPAKANIFYCEICGNYMSSSFNFPLDKLIVTNNGKFTSATFINGKHFKRKGIRICPTCWKDFDKGCVKTYKLTPKIAKLLLTEPAPEPNPNERTKNKTLFKMGTKKD